MSFAAPLPKTSKPGRRGVSGRVTWPLALAVVAIAAFVFYYLNMMGYLTPGVASFTSR